MTVITAFIKRRPVLTYFVLTFVISWGGILIVAGGPGAILGTREQVERLMPFVLLALFAGPSVASLLLTGLVDGRAGFRNLLDRMTRWRVGARWNTAALLTAPLLARNWAGQVRRAPPTAMVRGPDYRAGRGLPVGRVALPCGLLDY